MSLILNAIVTFDEKFKENVDLTDISDACFSIIKEACERKLAINHIYFRDEFCPSLQMNQMKLDISNSYIFCEVEKILLDDYSVKDSPHRKRLENLQGLIEFILNVPVVKELSVFMYDDGNSNFENIQCSIKEFAKIMQDKLFQRLSFAYSFNFKNL